MVELTPHRRATGWLEKNTPKAAATASRAATSTFLQRLRALPRPRSRRRPAPPPPGGQFNPAEQRPLPRKPPWSPPPPSPRAASPVQSEEVEETRGFRGGFSSSRSSCSPGARFSRCRCRRRRLSPLPPPPPFPPPPAPRRSAARGWGVRGRVSSPPSASPVSSFLLPLLLKRILWPQIATRLPPSVPPSPSSLLPPKSEAHAR
ncbi:myb-related transcription factor, partner of profilin-like [Piliocolobus tephrosceles]|uniref:myb-related transcription factor, partner of profilin-like n=1 Tax=Piliocolobus tephrosceles TaxID=591936 RepID=UPI0013017CD8|nr:myb-related transcription factor, partner of profilin-like [Piliocolobus tephrosceles]